MKEKKLAQQYAGLEQADQVDLYNGLESYYSVLGRNKQQEALAVLIGKDNHKIYVYQLNQGISQEKAEAVSKEKELARLTRLPLAVIKKSQSGKSSQALIFI